MKQHEENLDTALNNHIPEHKAGFWAELETQMSKHTPVVDESSMPPLLQIVDNESGEDTENTEPSIQQKRYGRGGIGFLAAAACVVAALGFAVSALPKTADEVEVASTAPIDYTVMRLETDGDEQSPLDRPTTSDDELQTFSVDAAQLGISSTEGQVAPDAISTDGQHALYVVSGAIVYAPINEAADPGSVVVFDAERFNDDVSQVITENASFSPAGSIVAIPHLEGIIIWNYQTNESIFYSICPGFACSYNTQDRLGDEVWFDETGSQLHFELVGDDGERTSTQLTFDQTAEDDEGNDEGDGDDPVRNSDDSEIPNVFDTDE